MSKHSMPYWLASLDADALADLMANRPEAAEPPPASLLMLADRLSTARSVRLALDGANRTTVDVLAVAQAAADDVTVDDVLERVEHSLDRDLVAGVFERAHRLGLMWPTEGPAYRLAPPLRGPAPKRGRLRVRLEPAAPRLSDVDTDVIDASAAAALLPTLRGVAQLVELCSSVPVQLLRTGGVGVKELRRLAKALSCDETRTRLWLALAYHADLLDNDDGVIVPTLAADGWLAGTPAEQFVSLVMTWWESPGSPTMPDSSGKLPPALAHAYHDDDRRIRHELVGWFADQPAGAVLLDRDELVALLCWRRPGLCGEPQTFVVPADVTIGEAEGLGVLAHGGLSSWGRALAGGGDVGAVGRWLPTPTGSARLQADLTAVVTGLPTRALSDLLDLAADAGKRDTASVWRFSAGSVRRALDAGYTADRLLAELAAAAKHDVPQPLEYLVRDVARRHGELQVVPVGCCVVASDPALVAEVAAHRSLTSLGLRELAPGVLAAAKPVRETMALLRQHGYAPVATSKTGVPVIERVKRLRAEPRATFRTVTMSRTEPDLLELATRLLEHPVVDPIDDDAFARHLPQHELALLNRAIEAETPVEIMYIDQNERRTRRVITPYSQAGDMLEAWCHLRDDERHFLISRIERVAIAPALD